jgi:hypothetical protein
MSELRLAAGRMRAACCDQGRAKKRKIGVAPKMAPKRMKTSVGRSPAKVK